MTRYLLRIARRSAAQVALHHVLIEPRHGHQQHDSCDEHLPEVAVRGGVVEEEDPRQGRGGHLAGGLRHVEMQRAHDEEDRQHEAPDQAQRLERIGPDQRLDAPLLRVEPDERHRHQGVDPERDAVVGEDQQLEHRADDVDPQGGAEHLRKEEEPGARPVRGDPEAVVEILVERDDPQPVEGRDQHEGHDQLSDREARHHLHVGERIGCDRSRNRNEGDARHRRPDHGKGRHVPRRAAVAGEEAGIVGPAAREPRHGKQHGDITQYGKNNGGRCHEHAVSVCGSDGPGSGRFGGDISARSCPMKEGAARYILGKDTKKLNTIYTAGRIRHSEKRRVRSGKIRIRTTGPGAAKAESGQIGQFPGTGGGQLHRRWMAGAETQSETGQREEAALRRRIQPIGQPEVDKSVNKNRSLPHAGGSGRKIGKIPPGRRSRPRNRDLESRCP